MNIHVVNRHIETQHANTSSQTIKSIVYGGVDGVITTYSIIAASYGASLQYEIIIILALSNLFADAFSMGFGDFISSKLENNYIQSEKNKEIIEYENNQNEEINELICLYENKGMTNIDATNIVNILVRYKELFIQQMMVMELELESEPDNYTEISKNSIYTFLSFLFFGAFPIYVYLIGYSRNSDEKLIFIISSILSGVTLFFVGIIAAKISKQNIFINGILTLFNGLIAGSIAYSIGYGFEHLMH